MKKKQTLRDATRRDARARHRERETNTHVVLAAAPVASKARPIATPFRAREREDDDATIHPDCRARSV
jgi:hypothetical protein